MPLKLKMDGDKVVVENGMPVFTHDDGKDRPFDVNDALDNFRKLGDENKKWRTEIAALEAAYAPFKEFKIEDVQNALATHAALSKGDLKTAEQIKAMQEAAKKAAEDQVAAAVADLKKQLEEAKGQLTAANSSLADEKIGNAFANSPFIKNKVAIPANILKDSLGRHFKLENGEISATGYDGNPLFSKVKPGVAASFEEALELLVDGHANRDSLLRGSGGGAGAQGSGGGAGGAKTMTRTAFEALAPADRAAKMKEGYKLADA